MSSSSLNLVLLALFLSAFTVRGQVDEQLSLTITTKEALNLYIDGNYITLPYSRNFSLTDTTNISSSHRLLALQGINVVEGCPGVLASVTNDYMITNASWKCSEFSGTVDWNKIGFDDSDWPDAIELKQNVNETTGGECDNLPYLPSISENAYWIWVVNTRWEVVYCRGYLPVCLSAPCFNGATCNQNEVALCTCPGGYTGDHCETEIDECESHPCVNGGNCTDFINGYECECPPGYTGANCETETNECDSNPCLNGATCNDNFNGYICSCAPGFTGTHCDSDVSECASNPCGSGGNCTELSNGYECECFPGYTGVHCETDIFECESHPCINGGTCHDLIDGYDCLCTLGYTGEHCESEFTACDSEPCQNGGSCTYAGDGYQCWCLPGFTGTNCETDIDECGSDPCLNDGTCRDEINEFECSCIPGFTGTLCETDIVECESIPCLNGGTCNEFIGSYECECLPSYTGIHCETEFELCGSDPCQNNGTCVPVSDIAYACECHPDFTGQHCETEMTYVTLIVTADRAVVSVYADNVEYPLDPSTSVNMTIPEYVTIPGNTHLIAIRGINALDPNCSGILASVGEDFVTDARWKCSSDNSQGWWSTDFDDSAWPFAVPYEQNSAPFKCVHRTEIPDIPSHAHWIWTYDDIVPVNCRGYLDSGCDSDPCLNGGTCIQSGGGDYTCSCDPQFTGDNCETASV